jgi:hypothetical protein
VSHSGPRFEEVEADDGGRGVEELAAGGARVAAGAVGGLVALGQGRRSFQYRQVSK